MPPHAHFYSSWRPTISKEGKNSSEYLDLMTTKDSSLSAHGKDYSCAYQREILAHGRMYISEHWLCFHANILSWETTISINFKDITSIKKKKTVKFIPNAIQICIANGQKLFFTSFVARTKTFNILNKVWKINASDKEMDFDYIWHWVHDARPKSVCSSKELDDQAKSTPSGYNRYRVFSEPASNHEMNDIDEEAEGETDQNLQTKNQTNYVGLEKLSIKRHLSDKLDQNTDSKLQFVLSSDSSSIDRGLGSSANTGSSSDSNLSDNVFETNCTCKSHFGAELLNVVLPVPMEELYAMIFEQCDASHKFHEFQKCSKPGEPFSDQIMRAKSFCTLNKDTKKIFVRSQECLFRTEIFKISQTFSTEYTCRMFYPNLASVLS
uniref:GRAM domain-containing protein n=1 Tax=Romanomermis culicivorax TaxID=13658 RepID=A0A915KDX5_ROMCU